MSRPFSTLALVLLSGLSALSATQQQIAFERGAAIWIANADGTSPKKIAKGSAPDLSPDGRRIAFHTDTSSSKDVIRKIAVVDVATKRVTVFKEQIPSENCQRAVWSPDGTRILFNIWSNNDWDLAMINADGTGFRYVKKATPKGNSFWSACWAPDGQSIYAQNLSDFCQLGLDGTEIKKWAIGTIFAKGGLSSDTNFSVSPNGKKLALDVEMTEEETDLPDWNGPPPSIWIFDLESETATRLTKKKVGAWHPCWLTNDTVLYCTQMRGEKAPTIYRRTVAQDQPTRILPDANNPSVSH